MRAKDLTNQVFTYLTALEPAESRRTAGGRPVTRWKCKCKCGKEVIVDTSALTTGNTKSCGCLNDEKRKGPKINIAGQRFGKLIVKQWAYNGQWECLCDCGNLTYVDHYKLISGNTKSCGCYRTEFGYQNLRDFTGSKIGKLVVLYRSDKTDSHRNAYWHCKCDCGNEVDIVSYSLTKENPTLSCGCIKSQGELKIVQILLENNIKFETQKMIKTQEYNSPLYFDFYLPDWNCCIEYDGQQHFYPVEQFGGQKQFELTQIRDNIKNNWCNDNGISLIRIPYTDYKILNFDYIKERLNNGK